MARYIKDFKITAPADTVFNAVRQYLLSEGYEYVLFENEKVFKKGNGVMTNPSFYKLSFMNSTLRFEAWMKYALMPGVYVSELGTTGFVGCATKGPFKRRIAQIERIIHNFSAQDMNRPASAGRQQMHAVPQSAVCQQPQPGSQSAVRPQHPQETVETTILEEFCEKCGTKLTYGIEVCHKCGHVNGTTAPTPQPAVQAQPARQSQPVMQHGQVRSAQQQAMPAQPVMQSGQAMPAQQAMQRSQLQTSSTGRYISKKDFRERYVPSFNKDVRNVAILCYICAGLNALICMLFNPLGVIDSLILLGLTLGMHLGKSKVCAILLLIFSCLEVVLSIALFGAPSAILWVIGGIWAVVTFNKADKQYNNYLAGNYNRQI